MMNIKMKKEEEEGNLGIDRLSGFPEDLLIHILSFLETKKAIQASLSLKKWVNLWTLIPNLHFDRCLFKNLSSFDEFVCKVLTIRDESAVKISRFKYYSRGPEEVPKYKLKGIAKFIDSHQVQHLATDALTLVSHDFGSVVSLKLQFSAFDCSLCLRQVVTLHIEKSNFFQPENFSGCPNLKNLTLIGCSFYSCESQFFHSSISSHQLSRLTISSCFLCVTLDPKLMLSTPRLAYLEIRGYSVPVLQNDNLDSLDTVDVITDTSYVPNVTLHLFSKLISWLKCFHSAKSMRLSSDWVKLLSKFPDALEREPSPFCNMKSLNIVPHQRHKMTSVRVPCHVMTYLLGKSPHAKTNVEFRGTSYVCEI